MGMREKIVDEVRNKIEEYESRMSNFLSEFNDWADLFMIKRPAKKAGAFRHSFSNPRTSEMFRAVNTLSTLMYRMQTAQDPYFDIAPVQLGIDGSQLAAINDVLLAQLRWSAYKRYLLKANTSLALFGTVFVEEPYEVVGINQFRRLPVTCFKPRSMLQVAFDRSTIDLEMANWLSTMDVVSTGYLQSIQNDKSEIGQSWIPRGVQEALDDKRSYEQNEYMKNRLARAGYSTEEDMCKAQELTTYTGELDCLNDGLEYIVCLANRRHIVRMHQNAFQHGRRPFRIAKWIEFEVDPLGFGVGRLLSSAHKAIDANRQKAQDGITMAAYNMWLKSRGANINDNDLNMKPMNVIETDEMGGLQPLRADLAGPTAAMQLEELLKKEFRAASGATDTLQAIMTDATASEVSLAQNESIRNISVKAEIAAEPLIREHLEIMHSNNVQFVNEPINVNSTGVARIVYPIDLRADVDFNVKVTTDKDYRPERMKKLLEMLQIITSIRNEHPDKFSISMIPIVKELARGIGGIDPNELVQNVLPPMEMGGLNPAMLQGPAMPMDMGAPMEIAGGALPPAASVVETHVGPVMGSAG